MKEKGNQDNPYNLHGPDADEAAKLNHGDFTDSRLTRLADSKRLRGVAAFLGLGAAIGGAELLHEASQHTPVSVHRPVEWVLDGFEIKTAHADNPNYIPPENPPIVPPTGPNPVDSLPGLPNPTDTPHDACLNINGVQTTVPEGLVPDGNGNCISLPTVTPCPTETPVPPTATPTPESTPTQVPPTPTATETETPPTPTATATATCPCPSPTATPRSEVPQPTPTATPKEEFVAPPPPEAVIVPPAAPPAPPCENGVLLPPEFWQTNPSPTQIEMKCEMVTHDIKNDFEHEVIVADVNTVQEGLGIDVNKDGQTCIDVNMDGKCDEKDWASVGPALGVKPGEPSITEQIGVGNERSLADRIDDVSGKVKGIGHDIWDRIGTIAAVVAAGGVIALFLSGRRNSDDRPQVAELVTPDATPPPFPEGPLQPPAPTSAEAQPASAQTEASAGTPVVAAIVPVGQEKKETQQTLKLTSEQFSAFVNLFTKALEKLNEEELAELVKPEMRDFLINAGIITNEENDSLSNRDIAKIAAMTLAPFIYEQVVQHQSELQLPAKDLLQLQDTANRAVIQQSKSTAGVQAGEARPEGPAKAPSTAAQEDEERIKPATLENVRIKSTGGDIVVRVGRKYTRGNGTTYEVREINPDGKHLHFVLQNMKENKVVGYSEKQMIALARDDQARRIEQRRNRVAQAAAA